jgi:superfamily II DNA/RNA helicase
VIKLEEEEKFVLIYALFKLELVRGKTLMFVSSVDRCYKASVDRCYKASVDRCYKPNGDRCYKTSVDRCYKASQS